jgi:hypothetical protein
MAKTKIKMSGLLVEVECVELKVSEVLRNPVQNPKKPYHPCAHRQSIDPPETLSLKPIVAKTSRGAYDLLNGPDMFRVYGAKAFRPDDTIETLVVDDPETIEMLKIALPIIEEARKGGVKEARDPLVHLLFMTEPEADGIRLEIAHRVRLNLTGSIDTLKDLEENIQLLGIEKSSASSISKAKTRLNYTNEQKTSKASTREPVTKMPVTSESYEDVTQAGDDATAASIPTLEEAAPSPSNIATTPTEAQSQAFDEFDFDDSCFDSIDGDVTAWPDDNAEDEYEDHDESFDHDLENAEETDETNEVADAENSEASDRALTRQTQLIGEAIKQYSQLANNPTLAQSLTWWSDHAKRGYLPEFKQSIVTLLLASPDLNLEAMVQFMTDKLPNATTTSPEFMSLKNAFHRKGVDLDCREALLSLDAISQAEEALK